MLDTNSLGVKPSDGFKTLVLSVDNKHDIQDGDKKKDQSNSTSKISSSKLDDNDNEDVIPNKQNMTPFALVLSFLSAIGGFLFGYDTGVVSGAVILLKDEFQLDSVWQEVFISVTLATAAITAIFSGYVNDKFGRKPTILVSSVIFLIGAVILGAAENRVMLIVGRAILGIAIGFSSATVPMYIAESAPSHMRGLLVSLNNMFIAGGQLVAGIVAGLFSRDLTNGWRFMLGFAAIPALLQLIGFAIMPESPRWLVKEGKMDAALISLQRIRGAVNIDEEIHEIQTSCEEENEGYFSSFLRIFQTPHVRWALFVGSMLQFFQQLIGINTVMYYSATIIKMSGVRSNYVAIWLAAVVAAINVIFNFVGLYLVERIGRRLLVLISIAGVVCSLVVLGIGFSLAAANTPDVTAMETINSTFSASENCRYYTSCNDCTSNNDCGFCYSPGSDGDVVNGSCMAVGFNGLPVTDHSLDGRCSNYTDASNDPIWAYQYCPNPFAWMTMVGLVLYIIFFAPGMGPMPWTINSEIYPIWARSAGNSFTTFINWAFNLLISMTFLTLTENITRGGAFFLYAGLAVLGFVVLYLFLPETKDKHLEEVELLFQRAKFIPCTRQSSKVQNSKSDIINDKSFKTGL